uniref:Formin-like 1 n=1 Tax=Nothobranchius furzeri TaxID=105023 RepID=A0A8C6VZW4_NOTFU
PPPPCPYTDVFFLSNTMNLPPDKVKILSQYDSEKKWDLICDQERFQVRNPPCAYLEKLRGYLEHGGNSRKFRRRIQESTQVLRELEISLRTNHIGWAEEFLNEENQGLNVLVDYLSMAHSAATYVSDYVRPIQSLERSVEDLCKSGNNSPTNKGPNKGFTLRSDGIDFSQNRRGQRGSQIVCQKDDVHLCIMCLRAIMNYRSGFNQVMKHPSCVNEITLSLNNRNPRTKALVLELLAAVCLVRGGHDITLSAFNNFKEVCGEKSRFEKLMEYFHKEDENIDFMVACMQFINIVVHSVENLNFRVHLQYEFSHHGLDDYLERLKFTESDRLLVQIQAYLDNQFDVGALLEDAEAKNTLLEHMEELQEQNTQLSSRIQDTEKEAMDKVSELEKKLIQTTKEVELLKVQYTHFIHQRERKCFRNSARVKPSSAFEKKPIQTKYRMPLFNWQVLKSSQVAGTIFSELDDEHVLQELDMEAFEEQFKTKAQSAPVDLGTLKRKMTHKASNRKSILEPNRAKNLAITLRKEGVAASDICSAIETLDFLELLERFVPTEYEMRLIQNYEAAGRPLDELSEEERFMVRFSKIPQLPQRINILTFMGNFPQSIQLLQPQLNAIIAASMSIRSSSKLKKILEIILAFGNYMNSSKRGPAYGFRLQSLDLLLDTKSTDRRQTLLHFMANAIEQRYPELHNFYTELNFLDKAALVPVDSLQLDLRALERGMELMKTQFSTEEENLVLKKFLSDNSELLASLKTDSKTAQEVYESTVEYFGEDPKTTPPSMFFPVFLRFIKAYKVRSQTSELAEQENKQVEKQGLTSEGPSSPTKRSGNKVTFQFRLQTLLNGNGYILSDTFHSRALNTNRCWMFFTPNAVRRHSGYVWLLNRHIGCGSCFKRLQKSAPTRATNDYQFSVIR